MPVERSPKIGIVSPCGTLNLGDEATVEVLIEAIRRRYPSAEIFGFTTNALDTERRHGIPSYPARNLKEKASAAKTTSRPAVVQNRPQQSANGKLRAALQKAPVVYSVMKLAQRAWKALVKSGSETIFLAKSRRRLKGTDLLIFAGSGQLCDDFGGAWGFPYTVFKWSILAKTVGAKIAFVSVGAGPIRTALSRIFIKSSLRLADYRSFRDKDSQLLVEQMGIVGDNRVFPDLVFSLRRNTSRPAFNGARPIIGINAFPHYDYRYWPVSEPGAYRQYIEKVASFASWLITHDYKVFFFPTQLRADPLVIDDIKSLLAKDGACNLKTHLVDATTSSFEELKAQISSTRVVIATRFHGVLVSFLLNKPVLGISHHSKVASLMRDMSQSEYLLDIEDFDLESLKQRFMSLESNSQSIKTDIERNVLDCRLALEEQFNHVFGLLKPSVKRG